MSYKEKYFFSVFLAIIRFSSYICIVIKKQSINLKTKDMINKDLENANLYVLNGIICDYFDSGLKPNIKDIRDNWQLKYLHISFKDSTISEMINNVQKFY